MFAGATASLDTNNKSLWRKFWGLAGPYWRSDEKYGAILLLIVIMAMNLGVVYVDVLINKWVNDFYNVLQSLDKAAFLHDLIRFGELAAAYIIQSVYMLYLKQMLQIKWRRWLTRRYLSMWLTGQTYYRMQFDRDMTDNPDQRISEDIGSFIDLTLTLSITLLSSVTSLIAFVTILWGLSGTLRVPLGSLGTWSIPGYMVWAAIGYSIVGTLLTIKVGQPLVQLNFNQQRYEADFRFSMVRLRENSESVALYRGEAAEQAGFLSRFTEVVDNYWQIMKRQKKVNWLTSGYNQLAVIFPVLMAAPRFFAGEMKLGGLMQTSSAFGSVHGALSYLVNSYTTIANWNAVMNRLSGFTGAIETGQTTKDRQELTRVPSADGHFAARSLQVFLPDQSPLLKSLDVNVPSGSSLLITGPSGSGKSTLVRALAGIWPFASGTVALPEHAKVMFLPQKPYLPLGTLRDAVLYPSFPEDGNGRLAEILDLCELGHLSGVLDKSDNWAQALSLGEQQRIAFARILLQQPDYVFLDEATASVDEALEAKLYQLVRSRLPHTTVISVGHRSTLLAWHQWRLHLDGQGSWSCSRPAMN